MQAVNSNLDSKVDVEIWLEDWMGIRLESGGAMV